MGSTEAARRAGTGEAAKANVSTKTAANASTSGSNGLTPYRNDYGQREAAAAPINPATQPTTASLAAEVKIRRKIPERCEPRATSNAD